MRLNSLTPKNIFYKLNKIVCKPVKTYSQQIAPRLSLSEIPSAAFSGNLVTCNLDKVNLSKLLNKIDGEVYKIKLFDKNMKKHVDAFLSYEKPISTFGSNPEFEKTLSVYDACAVKLGSVNLNFNDWKTSLESEFKEGLPKAYATLHMLESPENERYSGIGQHLVQACVEKSLNNGAQGRICLFADNVFDEKNDPFVFYHKMGLSVLNPKNETPKADKYIKEAAERLGMSVRRLEKRISKQKDSSANDNSANPNNEILKIYETVASRKYCKINEFTLHFAEWMYLHDNAVQKAWLPKIEANPIFSESNRVL